MIIGRPVPEFTVQIGHRPFHTDLGPLPQQRVIREASVSDEVHTSVGDREYLPIVLDLQVDVTEHLRDPLQGPAEPWLAPAEDDDVIHVAQVESAMEALLEMMVYLRQIEVGKVLLTLS